jgi:hypothetical protein
MIGQVKVVVQRRQKLEAWPPKAAQPIFNFPKALARPSGVPD